MLIDFSKLETTEISKGEDGIGAVTAKIFERFGDRIAMTKIAKGASLEAHAHENCEEIALVISGKGVVICDGAQVPIKRGMCHVTPRNSKHSIVNSGEDDLMIFTVLYKSDSNKPEPELNETEPEKIETRIQIALDPILRFYQFSPEIDDEMYYDIEIRNVASPKVSESTGLFPWYRKIAEEMQLSDKSDGVIMKAIIDRLPDRFIRLPWIGEAWMGLDENARRNYLIAWCMKNHYKYDED